MSIFEDDQTNINQKELARRAIADAGGVEIGSAAKDKEKRERKERSKHDADLSAVLTYQDQLEKSSLTY